MDYNYIQSEMRRYELMKAIHDIHFVMDIIDDGYHNEQIFFLTKISNELCEKLENERAQS